jgi:hypothetical protein
LTVAGPTASHLGAGAEVQPGPANESPPFTGVMDQAAARVRWARVPADAAVDAERPHPQCRDDGRIRSTVIPVNRRRAGRKWPRSRDRRPMRRRFFKRVYRQRWQAESACSRPKRLPGEALRSRSPGARERECDLRVLTHNLMILAAGP